MHYGLCENGEFGGVERIHAETHAKRDECHNWKACSQAQEAMSQRVSSSFYNANDGTVAICNNHRTL